MRVMSILAGLAMAAFAAAAPAAAQPAPARAQVMVLGTFHFHNPNADTAQFTGIDVMTAARQAEIEQVVADLARFRPTRIALEIRIGQGDQGSSLRSDYGRYRQNAFTLSNNEVHQLGFRLAHRLGHPEVYPIDYGRGLDIPELMAYAGEHDQDFARWFQQYVGNAETLINRMQATETINANLIWMNRPDMLALAQAVYAKMTSVGAAGNYVGARVAAQWYERNLYMFGNLAKIATPGERVLLIVGQGHAPILRQLVRDHPDMELVEPNDFLRPLASSGGARSESTAGERG